MDTQMSKVEHERLREECEKIKSHYDDTHFSIKFRAKGKTSISEEELTSKYISDEQFRLFTQRGFFLYKHFYLVEMDLSVKVFKFLESPNFPAYGSEMEGHGLKFEHRDRHHTPIYGAYDKEISCTLDNLSTDAISKILEGKYIPPGSDFACALKNIMQNADVTIEALSEMTGISPKTIQRMRTDASYNPTIQYVSAICIALHLFPQVSEKLISLAGLNFKNNRDELLYSLLIYTHFHESVYNCNMFLKRHNAKPLTNLM